MLAFFAVSIASVNAQVTIGENVDPQKFSLLELISTQQGMRLPQLTETERDELTVSSDFQNEKSGKAKGLLIYNTTENRPEFWNGEKWVAL